MRKKFEYISPFTLIPQLEDRQKALGQLIKLKESQKKANLSGKIRVVRKRKAVQFYHITEKGDKEGKYLPRKQDDFARELLQQEYDEKAVLSAKKELTLLKKLVTFYSKSSLDALNIKFSRTKRKQIEPVLLTNEEYAVKWQNTPYNRKIFYENSTEYFTSKNERVRSKSELIIANTLAQNNVPYRYEFPVDLKTENGWTTVHPDFYCLNINNRKEICWEHLGMMDNPDYAVQATAKLNAYIQSGWIPGKNLIVTIETSENPLQTKTLRKLISAYFDDAIA